MALIEVNNLVKDYKINQRRSGLVGALKDLIKPEHKLKRAVNEICYYQIIEFRNKTLFQCRELNNFILKCYN